MTLDHALNGSRQHVHVEMHLQMKTVYVVKNVGFRTQLAVKDHSRLKLRERISVHDIFGQLDAIGIGDERKRFELCNNVLGAPRNLDQFANGRMLKELFVSDVQSSLLGPGSHADAAHRVATEIEEVVVHANFVDTQLLAPDLRQQLFVQRARGQERLLRIGG